MAGTLLFNLLVVVYARADDIFIFFWIPAANPAGTEPLAKFFLVPDKTADDGQKLFFFRVQPVVMVLRIFPCPMEDFFFVIV